ncbi:MAG: DUF4743 domain-containing protein [Gammaproteobacteria bacterium]|nr:DUF4743 domain-containing protein [Gammaproteobacteria bacterium]
MTNDQFLNWLNECNACDCDDYVPFTIKGVPLGMVHKQKLSLFKEHPGVFSVSADEVGLNPALDNAEARTRAVDKIVRDWYAQGLFSGWRDEFYRVSASFTAVPELLIERAAASLFGVWKYGVHMNGFMWKNGRQHMWLARRSKHSPTWPGLLDQLVAGGLPAGLTPAETLIKECAEEAGIPAELARQAKPASLISYCTTQNNKFIRDAAFIYDLALPENFTPENTDGEVAGFYLWPIEKVIDKVAHTRELKPNANLAVIDFLVRHGYLDPADPHYVEIVKKLRS